MKDGPDFSAIAAAMGDPGRANMLLALMSGMALTAAELAREAGITSSTASGHLAKLKAVGLVTSEKSGRYRYFRLTDTDVAHAVEALVTVAARAGHMRTRPGPKDSEMRLARSCYDHLAGRFSVELFEHWLSVGVLFRNGETVRLTEAGREHVSSIGIELAALEKSRRPVCRTCIDWSERRNHLGGGLGAAVFTHALAKGWARRDSRSRIVRFSADGEKRFAGWYASGSIARP